MENYEKLYKEALERARELHDKHPYGEPPTWKTCEEIFPELKESEDERIRKWIIKELESKYVKDNIVNNANADKAFAWLEKQCESIKIKKGKNYLCTKTHKYAGVEWIKGTKYYTSDNYTLVNQGCEYYCPEYSKEEHNNLFEEVKYDGCLEKQDDNESEKEEWKRIEQPTEEISGDNVGISSNWSEEDERNFENVIVGLKTYKGNDTNISKWLESLKNRILPQKKLKED